MTNSFPFKSAGMRVEGENSLSTGAFDAVIDTGASLVSSLSNYPVIYLDIRRQIYLPFDIANHLWNNVIITASWPQNLT